MADHEDMNTHKKKHKKKGKSSKKRAETTVDTSTHTSDEAPHSDGQETAKPNHATTINNNNTGEAPSPRASSISKKIPLAQPQRKWTYEEERNFLKALQRYAALDNHKSLSYNRVDWTEIAITMEGIPAEELHEKYKKLIKKVPKLRVLAEVVEDAVKGHVNTEAKVKKVVNTTTRKPPPRPQNAFMLFCKAKRPSLVEKHPELSFAELHKKLCEKWRDIPMDKRAKYVKRHEKNKAKYVEELQQFEEEQRATIKKPLSAFELWKVERMEDELEEEQDEDLKDEWERMAKSMKKGWMQAALSEKDRYDSEINSLGCRKVKAGKKKATEKDTSTSDEAASGKRKMDIPTPKTLPPKKVKHTSSDSSSSSSSDDE